MSKVFFFKKTKFTITECCTTVYLSIHSTRFFLDSKMAKLRKLFKETSFRERSEHSLYTYVCIVQKCSSTFCISGELNKSEKTVLYTLGALLIYKRPKKIPLNFISCRQISLKYFYKSSSTKTLLDKLDYYMMIHIIEPRKKKIENSKIPVKTHSLSNREVAV